MGECTPYHNCCIPCNHHQKCHFKCKIAIDKILSLLSEEDAKLKVTEKALADIATEIGVDANNYSTLMDGFLNELSINYEAALLKIIQLGEIYETTLKYEKNRQARLIAFYNKQSTHYLKLAEKSLDIIKHCLIYL